jgi:hypothetical protein
MPTINSSPHFFFLILSPDRAVFQIHIFFPPLKVSLITWLTRHCFNRKAVALYVTCFILYLKFVYVIIFVKFKFFYTEYLYTIRCFVIFLAFYACGWLHFLYLNNILLWNFCCTADLLKPEVIVLVSCWKGGQGLVQSKQAPNGIFQTFPFTDFAMFLTAHARKQEL